MYEHGEQDYDGGFSRDYVVVSFMCCCGIRYRAYVEVLDHGETREVGDNRGRSNRHAFSRSGCSPCSLDGSSMTDEAKKPIRVNHNDAHIPPPSEKNIHALALKAWIDYSGQMSRVLQHEMPTWEELPDSLQQVWINIARGQHVVMTLLGGGKIEEIGDAE